MTFLVNIYGKKESFLGTEYSEVVKEIEKKYGKDKSFEVLDVKY